MKHIASVVRDGVAHYGIVDEDTGQLTQFAQILVPEHWDLESSALLGTNLVDVIGLNGKRHHKASPPKALVRQPQLELETPEEPPVAAPVKAAAYKPPKGKRNTGTEFFISEGEVLAVIAEHPEGIQVAQIAEHIWKQRGDNREHPPRWVTASVGNRVHIMKARAKREHLVTPYREEFRPHINRDGVPSAKMQQKYLSPLDHTEVT